jgi:hypothetical protein
VKMQQASRKFTVGDLKNIVELMGTEFKLPDFESPDMYTEADLVYTPTGHIGRTCMDGRGTYLLTDAGPHYRPRSRRFNPRWRRKMWELRNYNKLR